MGWPAPSGERAPFPVVGSGSLRIPTGVSAGRAGFLSTQPTGVRATLETARQAGYAALALTPAAPLVAVARALEALGSWLTGPGGPYASTGAAASLPTATKDRLVVEGLPLGLASGLTVPGDPLTEAQAAAASPADLRRRAEAAQHSAQIIRRYWLVVNDGDPAALPYSPAELSALQAAGLWPPALAPISLSFLPSSWDVRYPGVDYVSSGSLWPYNGYAQASVPGSAQWDADQAAFASAASDYDAWQKKARAVLSAVPSTPAAPTPDPTPPPAAPPAAAPPGGGTTAVQKKAPPSLWSATMGLFSAILDALFGKRPAAVPPGGGPLKPGTAGPPAPGGAPPGAPPPQAPSGQTPPVQAPPAGGAAADALGWLNFGTAAAGAAVKLGKELADALKGAGGGGSDSGGGGEDNGSDSGGGGEDNGYNGVD